MDNIGLIGMVSIIIAGLTMAIGSIGPAFAEGNAVEIGRASCRERV